MKSTQLTLVAIFSVALMLSTSDAHAQAFSYNTHSLGMGGAGSTQVLGYNAAFVNPANLAINNNRGTKWTVGLTGVNASGGGGLANMALYNQYYTTGMVITPELNMQIADKWFGQTGDGFKQLGFNVNLVPVGLSLQRGDMGFALTVRARVIGDVGMSKGVMLAATGLNSDVFGQFRQFDLTNSVLGFAEITAGFGMKVWETNEGVSPGTIRVFAGVAPKYLVPLHYSKVDLRSQIRVQDNPYEITHIFSYDIIASGRFGRDLQRFHADKVSSGAVPKTDGYFDDSFSDVGEIRGSGFALNLGATAEYYLDDFFLSNWLFNGTHRVRASFSVINLGSISITSDPTRIFNSATFRWDGLDADLELVDDQFDGSFGDYFNSIVIDSIGSSTYLDFNAEDLGSYKAQIPSLFTFGLSYDVGKLTLAADIGAGLNNVAINSKSMYLSLGTEFRPVKYIPIRFGLRTGGHASTGFSFGTGVNLKNFELTFAAMSVPNSEKNGTTIGSAFSGFNIKF